MTQRRTSLLVATRTREASSVRRLPVAAPSAPLTSEDAAPLAILVGHHVARAGGKPGAARLLAGYSYTLRRSGRGYLVPLASGALNADGGHLLRQLARATVGDAEARQRATSALVRFVRFAGEHEVRDHGALTLLLRGVLAGAVVDAALVRLLAAHPDEDDAALVTRLGAGARLDTLSGLQLAREAAAERRRAAPPAWPVTPATAPVVRVEADDDEGDDEEPTDNRFSVPGERGRR